MYNEPLRVATALNNLALAVWNNGDPIRATAFSKKVWPSSVKLETGWGWLPASITWRCSPWKRMISRALPSTCTRRSPSIAKWGVQEESLIHWGIWPLFWRSKVMPERLPRITPRRSRFATTR